MWRLGTRPRAFSIEDEARTARNERHAEEMRELYHVVAHDPGERTTIWLSAATHLLNRIEGLPVAKVPKLPIATGACRQ